MTESAHIDGDTGRKLQATALIEMFVGMGAEAPPERVAYYLRLLGRIPPFLLRAACDKAVLDAANGFPPGPGEIMRAAESIQSDRAKRERKQIANEQWQAHIQSVASGNSE